MNKLFIISLTLCAGALLVSDVQAGTRDYGSKSGNSKHEQSQGCMKPGCRTPNCRNKTHMMKEEKQAPTCKTKCTEKSCAKPCVEPCAKTEKIVNEGPKPETCQVVVCKPPVQKSTKRFVVECPKFTCDGTPVEEYKRVAAKCPDQPDKVHCRYAKHHVTWHDIAPKVTEICDITYECPADCKSVTK